MAIKETDKNYYELLNLPNFSSPEEIRKKYYLFAQKYHPDRQKNAGEDSLGQESFARITQAFNILKDPLKKERYDVKLRQQLEEERKNKLGESRVSSTLIKDSSGNTSIASESFQQGVSALQKKEYPRALYLFRTALKEEPKNASFMSYYALSLIYNKGKLSECTHYASKAIEKEPFRLEFKLNMAKIYYVVGAKTQTLKWINEILGLDPDFKEAIKLKSLLESKLEPKKEGFVRLVKNFLRKNKK